MQCVADSLINCLPPWLKAQLPARHPPTWLPEGFRDESHVLRLDIDVRLEIHFEEGHATQAATKGAAYVSRNPGNPFLFEVALSGDGCWPSIGQLRVAFFSLTAHARLWWDVMERKMAITFLRDDPAHVDWEVALSLFDCGMPVRPSPRALARTLRRLPKRPPRVLHQAHERCPSREL